jgi:hypothetical protein
MHPLRYRHHTIVFNGASFFIRDPFGQPYPSLTAVRSAIDALIDN